jgi:hypothetical protein
MTNYIDINGYAETIPKLVMIQNKPCCEFLLCGKACVKSHEIYESFSIPVLLSRKNAKRCLANLKEGKWVRVQGSLSFNDDKNRTYTGFYINVDTIKGIK